MYKGKRRTIRQRLIRWYCEEFGMMPGDLDLWMGPVRLREFTLLWALAAIAICAVSMAAIWAFCCLFILAGGIFE